MFVMEISKIFVAAGCTAESARLFVWALLVSNGFYVVAIQILIRIAKQQKRESSIY